MPGECVENALELSAGPVMLATSFPSESWTTVWKNVFFAGLDVKTQRNVSGSESRKTTAEFTRAPSRDGVDAADSRICRTAGLSAWRGNAAAGGGPAAGAAAGIKSGLTIEARATVSWIESKRPGFWIESVRRDGSTTILIWSDGMRMTSRIRLERS